MIGEQIRNILKKEKITQKKFCKAIGISETAMSQITNDVYFPSEKTLKKICDELDLQLILVKKEKLC